MRALLRLLTTPLSHPELTLSALVLVVMLLLALLHPWPARGQDAHELDLPAPPVRLGDPPAATPRGAPPADADDGDPRDTPPPVFYGEEIETESERIYYVLDRSGSMRADDGGSTSRWQSAVAAAKASIAGLPDSFRFGVRVFDCGALDWSSRLEDATDANKAAAIRWLGAQHPGGNTGTGPAVAGVLARHPGVTVVLLTDGEPTCGTKGDGPITRAQRNYYARNPGAWTTPEQRHRKLIRRRNRGSVINVFGIQARGAYRAFCQGVAADSGGSYYDR